LFLGAISCCMLYLLLSKGARKRMSLLPIAIGTGLKNKPSRFKEQDGFIKICFFATDLKIFHRFLIRNF
jgi:hypothetical protein